MNWSGWSLGLHIRFVGWYGIGQSAHLAIDLDTDAGWELIPLLHTGVQLTEPELYLVQVVQLGAHPDVSVAGNVGRLLRAQHELKLGFLEPTASCKRRVLWSQILNHSFSGYLVLLVTWVSTVPRECRRMVNF